MGVASARNQAFKISTGDLIILLDDDTILECDVIANGSEYLKNNQNIGILGPKLLFINRDIQPSVEISLQLEAYSVGLFLKSLLQVLSKNII